jgi:hypothetical protein
MVVRLRAAVAVAVAEGMPVAAAAAILQVVIVVEAADAEAVIIMLVVNSAHPVGHSPPVLREMPVAVEKVVFARKGATVVVATEAGAVAAIGKEVAEVSKLKTRPLNKKQF